MKLSAGEMLLEVHLRELGIPFETEYRFAPPRRWRADFAILEHRILVEVEGGVFSGGRHARGAGYTADLEKYNAATLLGWIVYRFSTDMVMDGTAQRTIAEALGLTEAAGVAQ